MAALESAAEITSLLEQWENESNSGTNMVKNIQRMAEIVEAETESWYKMDPDPFDDRHPGRADPKCALGHILKALFKNDNFTNKMVNSYLMSSRDQFDLHVAASRLLLDITPGLEITVVFQENEGLVERLLLWAEESKEPLQSYATGLLAGAMEVPDIAAKYKERNATMRLEINPSQHLACHQECLKFMISYNRQVPVMLGRLHKLQQIQKQQNIRRKNIAPTEEINLQSRPFAIFAKHVKNGMDTDKECKLSKTNSAEENIYTCNDISSSRVSTSDCTGERKLPLSPMTLARRQKMLAGKVNSQDTNVSIKGMSQKKDASHKKEYIETGESSNSRWSEIKPFIIGTYCMWPLGVEMQQRLILQYLTPLGEYQELLSHVFEQKAMELIGYYIDLTQNGDVRLAFEALKYLAALLCHKKFAVEFITQGGVQRLLDVYRPSVAATGVSMCLYYLAYFEDAMERVCLLSHSLMTKLVKYVLWLLECSHESGRCHATMFFSMAFPFRVILELFDLNDGLRKLVNVISTREIICIEERSRELTDDEVFTSRQSARHVSVALKKYMEAHIAIRADQIRRTHVRNEGRSPLAESPAYKAAKYPPEVIQGNIDLLLEGLTYRRKWEPVSNFIKLGGVPLLLQLVAMASEWNAYTGKGETIKSALDVLTVCTVMPQTQLLLCNSVLLPDNVTTPAFSILLGLAEGEVIEDPDIQKSALSVIINCVCGPQSRLIGNIGRIIGGSAKKKTSFKNDEVLLNKMWDAVRSNNGIMILLKLLMVKRPITEADAIRALACRAIVGLSRCEKVEQIVSKLPLFSGGQLTVLMKEPVLQEKRQEHVKFCKYATELIEVVSGKPRNASLGASLDKIRMAHVVAQTKIVFREKELLQLIHEHLQAKGLSATAAALEMEAELPRSVAPLLPTHPAGPLLYLSANIPHKMLSPSSPVPSGARASTSFQGVSATRWAGPLGSPRTVPGNSPMPVKLNIISSKSQSSSLQNLSRAKKIREKHEASGTLMFSSPALQRRSSVRLAESSISLDTIVTEYLRKQHATCQNPVVTCPPFSLLSPHRCPEPIQSHFAPLNITSRILRKNILPPYGGPGCRTNDRKFIYSRFRPVRSYRDTEEDGCFSCCAFSADEEYLMLGTYAGELKMFNVQTGEEGTSYVCHNSPITVCEPSRDGSLVLTSCSWGRPSSALWSMGNLFELKHSFDEDNYLEFSKQTQDWIVGTKEEKAHIYDVTTGRLINTLFDGDKANNYTRNRATFNPTDDLVLNDGVLWDMSSAKAIHKFDKFNPNVNGIFHPMGMEIIIDSEVWDLRTFHLLHTVPALHQCQIRFNSAGDVIYGAIHQSEDEDSIDEDSIKSPFGSSFRTFDGRNYSNIATIDVKKNIFDLCTDSSDCYLAVIENQRSPETLSEESLCRLYEVGRLRDEEDDLAEEEEEEEENDDAMDDEEEEDDDEDDDDDDEDDENQDLGHDDNDGDDLDEMNREEGSNSDDNDDQSGIISFEEDVDDDDDDLDDVYFELSDLSNF